MSKKKSFGRGIDAILGESPISESPKRSEENVALMAPKKPEEVRPEKPAKPSPSPVTTKVTLRLSNELVEKIKALAYWERKSMTEVYIDAFDSHFDKLGSDHMEMAIDSYKKTV